MSRVVIICHDPLIVQTEQNFMIAELMERGFEVEYWDVSSYVDGGLPIEGELEREYLLRIESSDELESNLRRVQSDEHNRTIFVVEVHERWENRHFFRRLSSHGCYMISMNLYANVIEMGRWDRLRLFARQPIQTITLRLKQMAYRCYKRREGYTTIRDHFSSSPADRAMTQRINHPDYERYRKVAAECEVSEEHILFIDNYFPEHPDIRYRHKYTNLDGAAYRQSLMRYFDRLETRYGIPVVVAAHPKAHYTAESFGGRTITQNRSVEGVLAAAAVVLHTSNAVSFALLADKPVGLISNSEYRKCRYLQLFIERISAQLSSPIRDIDSEDGCQIERIDTQIRREYIYKYLTDPSIEQRSNIEILTHYINHAEL